MHLPDLEKRDFFLWGLLCDELGEQTLPTFPYLLQIFSDERQTLPMKILHKGTTEFVLQLRLAADDGYFKTSIFHKFRDDFQTRFTIITIFICD